VTHSFRTQGENELKELRKLPPGPKTDDLKRFYDLSQRIIELNTAVLDGVLAHPSSGRMMSAGRVVVLSDGVSPSTLFLFRSLC
jgi:antiviral helicase SKI2